ncbi:acyl-CoA dehydrogenase family protein [Gordonia humi]|uniref:Alkylation response protein AidB-like acyl-CoA dehydrogenase n=1 Tax=Gordonia humi TaxID=686429 RepID=A0A840F247_9ACTN|nr:acyl-CoA dehydrogenase family protein [Gordonia humi]MBB4136533.1 alkylation response protein AidB-like acyl-CoA dehydrogenase [Gordonia humi]
MDFDLTAEQQLLRDGLTHFLAARYDLESSRKAVKTGAGWQPEIWRAFADELGILGATLPESVGGMGGGPAETMVIAEALGHALVVEPYVNTVVVAGGLLARIDSPAARGVAEKIAEGDAIVAFAAAEDSSDDLGTVTTTARRDGDAWVLDGFKALVVDAPLATHLLVTAQTDDGVGLFVAGYDADAAGVTAHAIRTVDDRQAADLELSGWRIPADALLATGDDALAVLHRAVDAGVAAICAEAVGAMRKVLDDTVEYSKQRQQFGVPLSSFQVLSHRMVDMLIEVEQASAAALLATIKLDAAPDERARAVSAAKVTIGRAARFVGQNAVQLHGGMGMTEELAIGHYFKRLSALQYEYGTTDRHLARYAALTTP